MKQVLRMMCVGACVVGAGLVGGCGGDAEPGSVPAGADTTAKKPSFNADAVKGALVFRNTCVTCHGGDAKGLPNNGPDLTASAFVRDTSNADLLTYVIEGREVPGGVPMPPRGGFTEEMLPDSDIEKVIVYMKNFPGNKP
ncbi:MAG: cytochrome c [Phycisphaerales bacterium]|nr:cytochrome c [Phycisphaerales bacterium]